MKIEIPAENDEWAHPVVLYDAACPICRTAVRRWRPFLEPRGISFLALQSSAARARLGLAEGELPIEMKLSLPDGTVVGGHQAVAYLFRRVWWAAWVGWLMECPGLRVISDRTYRWVARNRTCLGDVCTLPVAEVSRHHGATSFFENP